ncbi:MAG: hypothetical protein AABX89_06330 [Candidatus Thermoplasmatota archaeon]
MRPGIGFPHRHPHEAAHLRPLMDRLQDVLVAPPREASVVVQAASDPPVRGAWNVQIFHGLGDKAYTLNPLFLQRGRFPRLRTAMNAPLAALRLPAPFLRPPRSLRPRRSRYQQLNAYGPRWRDLLEERVRDAHISRFGHVALNELGGLASDPDGPVVWMPTWDNRRYLGGPEQSSLRTFSGAVMELARHVPVLVKLHPLTVSHNQQAEVRRRLASAPGITLAPAGESPYRLLEGARAVLTDTSSLGFEAYCSDLPVALAKNPGVTLGGLHAELDERVPGFAPGQALRSWGEAPEQPDDTAWARDLLDVPVPGRNDAFAADLRSRMLE